MSVFKKTVLICGLVNLGILLFSFAKPEVFIVFFLACVLELVAGILLLIGRETRPIGQAVLLVSSVGLLIGFSVCSGLWMIN